jgi:hypothetical protein
VFADKLVPPFTIFAVPPDDGRVVTEILFPLKFLISKDRIAFAPSPPYPNILPPSTKEDDFIHPAIVPVDPVSILPDLVNIDAPPKTPHEPIFPVV